MARSILAVVGGYAVTVVCVVTLDFGFGALIARRAEVMRALALVLIVLPSMLAGGYLRANRLHASKE